MSCHHEHHGGHHGHDDHSHDDDITPAIQHSLYSKIHFDEVVTLNERHSGSGKAIVQKTWDERWSEQPELVSDADEQLLMTVPFVGQVKLHEIRLRTSPASCAPRTLHVFTNRDTMDFEMAQEAKPLQTFALAQTSDVQILPVKRALFHNVRKLVLFFPDNFSCPLDPDADSDDDEDVESTRIEYLGFKGEWMDLGRVPVNITYESAANPSDHAIKGTSVNKMGHGIGGGGPTYGM